MRRKLWVVLSLVLVLSIVFSNSVSAANPVLDTFLGGNVTLRSTISATTGYGSLIYDNAGHPGTTYTNIVQISYTYHNDILPLTSMHTVTRTSSVQNGNAYVSYNAPASYHSYSVGSYGKISELGEIWVGMTSSIYY